MAANRKKPGAGRRRVSEVKRNQIVFGESTMHRRLPDNWRDRLPDPHAYYTQHIDKLGYPNQSGYAQGRCPFHEDRAASFSVKTTSTRGHWKCFAGCGAGDMISFHERITGLSFPASARDLLGMRA